MFLSGSSNSKEGSVNHRTLSVSCCHTNTRVHRLSLSFWRLVVVKFLCALQKDNFKLDPNPNKQQTVFWCHGGGQTNRFDWKIQLKDFLFQSKQSTFIQTRHFCRRFSRENSKAFPLSTKVKTTCQQLLFRVQHVLIRLRFYVLLLWISPW